MAAPGSTGSAMLSSGSSGGSGVSSSGVSRPSSAASSVPVSNPWDEFQSLGIIGRGKYSEVHRAVHRRSGETVAIKRVQIFEMDSDGRKECINEANMLQSLPSHPHIIQYKQSFLYENDLYLILELASHGDISLLIEAQRKKGSYFQEAEIWHYFVQIADALGVMHSCRVMHRDLKPGNVFLTSSSSSSPSGPSPGQAHAHASPLVGVLANSALTIKLGDLGLGRYMSSKTMETFSCVGTPFYMSPEAISASGYEFKSDIWSCGCLLYELAALKSPFYSTSLNFYTLGNKITKAQYDPPPQHFSKTLRSLLHWMIQPSPADRPDIGQVLRVAQLACHSILRSGAVSDAIPVGAGAGAALDAMGPPLGRTLQQHQQQQSQHSAAAADQTMDD